MGRICVEQDSYLVAVRLKFDAILEMNEFSTEVIERDIHDVLAFFESDLSPCSADKRSSSFWSRSCNEIGSRLRALALACQTGMS